MKPVKIKKWNEVLVLRTCNADMTSHNGFKWKKSGYVSCPNWNDKAECGHGLHGLLKGVGDAGLLSSDKNAKWLIVKTDKTKIVDISGKVKFPYCYVIYCGTKEKAIEILQKEYPNEPIVFSTQTAGNRSTQTAGDASTQTAGNRSTQTAGYASTQTAGYASTQTAGDASTQTAGDASTQTAGDASTQTAGVNTVQIIQYWKDNVLEVKVRKITEKEANKWYKFENEDWRLCTEEETKSLDGEKGEK